MATFDRRIDRGQHLPGLALHRRQDRTQVDGLDRPVAVLQVLGYRVEHFGDSFRRDDSLPRLRGNREVGLRDEQEVQLIQQRTEGDRALLPDPQPGPEELEVESIPESFPGER
jgi:hypothetical protein